MKLRNKKTGEVTNRVWWDDMCNSLCVDGDEMYFYDSLTELIDDWEDYEAKELTKYYLINEETGYVATFDTEHEMKIFEQQVKGWRRVKVE